MNKIIVGIAVTALIVIAGIMAYQFVEQKILEQELAKQAKLDVRQQAYQLCLEYSEYNYNYCGEYPK